MDPSAANYDRTPNRSRQALKKKLLALTGQQKVGANQQELLSIQSQAVDPVGLKQALRQMQEAGDPRFLAQAKPRVAPFGGPEDGRPGSDRDHWRPGPEQAYRPTQPGFNRKGSLGNIEAYKAQRGKQVGGLRTQAQPRLRKRTPKQIRYRGT